MQQQSKGLISIYRFSDGGQKSPSGSIQNKQRPAYFNKRTLLLQFIKVFTNENLYIVADNVTADTLAFLSTLVKSPERIIQTDYKSGALSFLHSVHYAISESIKHNWNDNTPFYFVEDDYIHIDKCDKILLEGLQIADYVTAYDHPDKYIKFGGNPLLKITDGRAVGESTIVFLTESSHWKVTNSTTMTFATTLKIIKEDMNIYQQFCNTGYPNDFEMFLELAKTKRHLVISPMPAYSTHCETGVLAPLREWNSIIA